MKQQEKHSKKEVAKVSTLEKWNIFLYSANTVFSLGFSILFFLNFILLKSINFGIVSLIYFIVFLGSWYYLFKFTQTTNKNESSRSGIGTAKS